MDQKLIDVLKPFNLEDIPFALFYKFKYALRFELGIGNNSLSNVISAFDRSREVVKNLILPNFKETYVLFRLCNDNKTKRNFFETLLDYMNIARTDITPCGVTLHPNDHDLNFQWYVMKLRMETVIDSLLWISVSHDMGYRLQIYGNIYFLDRHKRLLIHAYDDRGMDVVSMDKESLLPVYYTYNKWLLDYDRERMTQTFSSQ